MNLQVSRIWHRRYGRPRTASGTFAPGVQLYTRADKSSRWLVGLKEGSYVFRCADCHTTFRDADRRNRDRP